jgi:hypothetical protein
MKRKKPDLFDWAAARDGKKDGMARVEEHADKDWKEAAENAVVEAALASPLLTSDDVMIRIDPGVETHELRALGSVMLRAAKNGWIEKAPLPPVNCARPSRHCAPLTVWKSLLFRSDA